MEQRFEVVGRLKKAVFVLEKAVAEAPRGPNGDSATL